MANEKERAEMLENHEERLVRLERNQEEFSKQMTNMQGSLTEIENTVMKGNNSTQEMQREIKELQQESSKKVDRVFDILADQVKSKNNNEAEYKKARLSMWERIFVALAGTGGLAGIVSVVSALIK